MSHTKPRESIDFAALVREMARAPHVVIEMNAYVALSLLGHLQLAFRHPEIVAATGATSARVRDVAALIELKLGALGPNTAALCAAGWNAADGVKGGSK